MTTNDRRTAWSPARRLVVGIAAALAAIVWSHGLAAVLRHLGPEDAPLAAVELTLAAMLAAAVGAAWLPRPRAEGVAAVVAAVAALAIELALPGSSAGVLAVVPVAIAVTGGGRWLGSRLPASLDLAWSRRRVAALAWLVLALAATVQTGRLASFMTDRELGFFLTTEHPFWYGHECLGAYLYGAELAARGEENIYDPAHYAGLDPAAEPESRLEGVALEDPYQYPPQFLLLPRLALALTWDVATIRVVWYALQVTLFAAVAAALALFVGGRSGRLALWLLPGVMVSFPALHNFQFGQFHLPAVALAVAGMMLLERRRPAAAGALLSAAILAKIFPAVLLPVLLFRRRFRALAWTVGWGLSITAVALAVLGTAPFAAFLGSHLGHLGDGSAFAFDEAWPELAELVVADNQGVFGLARKIGLDRPAAATVGRAFGLLVFGVAALFGLRRSDGSRLWTGAGWLALLGLGSLASPGAWGDYVPVTAVWLLSLLAAQASRGRILAGTLALVGVFQFFVLGTMPLGSWAPIGLMVAMSAVGVLLMLGLFGTILALPPRVLGEATELGELLESWDRDALRPAA